MSCSTHTLLDHTDLTLHLGDMFISECGVEDDTGRSQFVFHRHEFTVHEHVLDSKATCAVNGLYVLGRLHDLLDRAVTDVLGGSELDLVTNVAKLGTLLTKKRSPDRVTYLLADRICGWMAT